MFAPLMSLSSPRLLIEPSDYVLRNIGDLAMLCCATERLSAAMPSALLQVLTWEADFATLCPVGEPLWADGRNIWLKLLPKPIARAVPPAVSVGLRLAACSWVLPMLRKRKGRGGRIAAKIESFLDAARSADALIVTGMGGITDFFPDYAYELLETMSLALRLGRRVFMVGQAIGPLSDRHLRSRAAAVLPKVELIGVREKRASVPLLQALGVSSEQIVVTGDDAVELGHGLRAADLGNGIGFNLRIADYAAVSGAHIRQVAEALRCEADLRGVAIVPLPVSAQQGDADAKSVCDAMPELAGRLEHAKTIQSPRALVEQMRGCRVVVVGSYHAAVFALSQGIPAIGLASSSYYVDKFAGLQDMFGEGSTWVDLNQAHPAKVLRQSLERLWDDADLLRPGLLAATEAQIASGKALYRRMADMLTSAEANA